MKMVHCPCGVDVSGETDEELVQNVQNHVQKEHPELTEQYSREQILAIAHDH